MRLHSICVVVACLAGGCDLPRDPEGTTERVDGGVIRVGVMHEPPWAVLGDDGNSVSGIEATLAEQFAAELHARIEWQPAGESRLMALLQDYQLDLVIGGLTESSVWRDHVGLTRPYIQAASRSDSTDATRNGPGAGHVLAVPPGENRWLLTVEQFLERKRTEASRLLEASGDRGERETTRAAR